MAIHIHLNKPVARKAKDADRYDPVVERMPVAINGKRYRPKIVKNEASAVWVSTQLFATEQEAMAEAKRQIAKATKDVDEPVTVKKSSPVPGFKIPPKPGTEDALTPEQLRSDAKVSSSLANEATKRANNRLRHRTAELAHQKAMHKWEEYALTSAEAKSYAQNEISRHRGQAQFHAKNALQ